MPSNVRIVRPADVAYLDDVLLDGDRMRLLPARALREYPHDHLALWAQRRGRYNLPTRELVEYLKGRIGGRRVIEIGAGMGDLGYHLGISMTDSYMQTSPEIVMHYMSLGAMPIRPPPDVERLEALEAVRKYKPEVVLAAWVTQLYRPGDEGPPKIGSSVYGVDEMLLLKSGPTYLHVGNRLVHGDKRALALPHKEHELPFLVSRGFDQNHNVIYEWGE